ncbi:hypothetical protein B9Z55_021391 [Caenorhabditis nigoni]|uniref:Uncharacterized protein n=1 Tax=Caenorhabditis nigoni TaxID=1611254 RepID=A0A2G5TRS1_9PELO|nr:hypothetical protein B9Z55_021391 [Caenorhabditis nigoni]
MTSHSCLDPPLATKPYEFISRNKYKPIDLRHNKKGPRQTMVTFVMCFNQQSFHKALKLKKKKKMFFLENYTYSRKVAPQCKNI